MARWTDQQRMESLRSASATALARIQEDVGPVAHRLADRFFQAIDFQLMADFRYREAERVEALGLENERAQVARRTADRYNTACLDVLTEDIPSAIEEVRRQFGGQTTDLRDTLAIFEQEGRGQIADMDLKGEHAAAAARTLSETIAVANASGINGLCDQLRDQASKFAELRRRRPEHNDPTALVVGGTFVGVGGAILAICMAASAPKPCTNSVALGLSGALIALGGFILLSELGGLIYIAAA
jgi:hypothetical protein